MNITVAELHIGDLIRFAPAGHLYRVAARNTHTGIPGLITITFTSPNPLTPTTLPGPMTMPRSAPVQGVSLMRRVTVPCLLCKKDQLHDHNLVDGGTPRACVCATCNTAVDRIVFAPSD